jgi:sulfite exporter TauE/SafE
MALISVKYQRPDARVGGLAMVVVGLFAGYCGAALMAAAVSFGGSSGARILAYGVAGLVAGGAGAVFAVAGVRRCADADAGPPS